LLVVSMSLSALACERPAPLGADHLAPWPEGIAPCDQGEAEICNRRDDDCDGQVDEEGICDDPCRPVMLARQTVLRADGAVFTWGVSHTGRPGASPQRLAPQREVLPEPATQVTNGCARAASGRAYCWLRSWSPPPPASLLEGGGNTVAQIVRGVTGGLTCVRRMGPEEAGSIWCWDRLPVGPHHLAQLGNDVEQVACGAPYGACVRTGDGSVWCAPQGNVREAMSPMSSLGAGNVGLGIADAACALDREGQVRCAEAPFVAARTVDFGGPVAQLSFDPYSCVLRRDGAVACLEEIAVTGPEAEEGRRPVVPAGLERDVVELAGQCARKRDHTVWCWGDAPVGDGTKERRAEAVQIDVCPERS
jgi:hypothetical protein